ncbi:MAG: hypothetical protein CM1200mP24_07950 [Gammaproteobacteria bacterium]|nr:MAG: hypothetical protein CM1200mP24_07950 [Gammaproteobacteria bacterium]
MDIKDGHQPRNCPTISRTKRIRFVRTSCELGAFGYTILPPEKVGPLSNLCHQKGRDTIACERKKFFHCELENVSMMVRTTSFRLMGR